MARNAKTACYFEGLSDNSVIIVCTMIYHALSEFVSGARKTIKFEGNRVEGKSILRSKFCCFHYPET
jgi:Domain of unknown function (DUF6532)